MFISYAQNFEDVMLWRALKHVEKGFYIDVGAQHPVIDSVSLAFYEHGWRGIHIEPNYHYAQLLQKSRPDETVIQAAVSGKGSVLTFYEIADTGLSTGDAEIAERHRASGFAVNETSIPCITLANVFELYAGREIHWLKIDVEGLEEQVLQSWEPSMARPWIVIIESTLPLTQIESHDKWEKLILDLDYQFVYFDGLNRFYLSKTHSELKDTFSSSPNVFDDFALSGTSSAPFSSLLNNRYSNRNQELGAQIAQGQAEIQRLHQVLVARDQELGAQISQGHAEIQHLHEVLVARDQELGARISQGHAEIQRLHQVLVARDQELGAQVSQGHAEIQRLHQVLVARDQELGAQISQGHAEIQHLQQTIDAMCHSTSWRFTQPLRKMNLLAIRGTNIIITSVSGLFTHSRSIARNTLRYAWEYVRARPVMKATANKLISPFPMLKAHLKTLSRVNTINSVLQSQGRGTVRDDKSSCVDNLKFYSDSAFTPTPPVIFPKLTGNRKIYYYVDHTILCPVNTGMQRVTRRLGRALLKEGELVSFVKWDDHHRRLVLLNHDELSYLSQWHGPALKPGELDQYPAPNTGAVTLDLHEPEEGNWLIVPEVTHITYQAQPMTMNVILEAKRHGLKTAFVYYDAIPLRRDELKGMAQNHETYMQQLLLADLVVPISDWSARDLVSFFHVHEAATLTPTPRIVTIPLPGESQQVSRVTMPATVDGTRKLILSVGSIELRKNQVALVHAFEKYCAAHPNTDWHLVLVGCIHADVKSQIERALRQCPRIRCLQDIPDKELAALYRACAFTVFPSIEEGFGLPILESLWYGKPCICANFGAMSEVAEGGGCLPIDTRVTDELLRSLTRLTMEPGLLEQLSQQAMTRTITSWRDYGQRFITLLDEASNPLNQIGVIYYWIDHTSTYPANTGIQRVVRGLARALLENGLKLIPVKWDRLRCQFYAPSHEELSHLNNFNGPPASAWNSWIDPSQSCTNDWVLIPELVSDPAGPDVIAIKQYIAENNLRGAWVFYDAIPWKMRDLYPDAVSNNHARYMKRLNEFELVFPISHFSRIDLISFLAALPLRTPRLESRIQACILPGEFLESDRITEIKQDAAPVTKILCVGTVEPRKNHLCLLQAFEQVVKQSKKQVELIIAGGAPFPELSDQVQHYINMVPNIRWEKGVNDTRLRELYAECDFTVYPSLEEGFGLPILESLWYARPCICRNSGAMVEVAEGGGCLMVETADANALAQTILSVVENDSLRLELAGDAVSRPVKTWHDYAREVATRMATERYVPLRQSLSGPMGQAKFYGQFINLRSRPLLSICISTYNRAEWLALSLKNLAQLIPNPRTEIEIVVCDNTSTDHTPDVVGPYLNRQDFRYYCNAENVGMLGNLRVTAHHASGHYIWILGDDDLIKPGSVERVLQVIQKHPSIALIYLNYAYTRQDDAKAVTDLDRFLNVSTPVAAPGPDILGPVHRISTKSENFFTAIYCLVFRRDHALRAYSQNTDGRPFSTMLTCIPTTYHVLNFMMHEPAYWVGEPQVVVNLNVSWMKYASIWILERLPEAHDIAEKMGASSQEIDRCRINHLPHIVHWFGEIFTDDHESNIDLFSPSRLLYRMKHLEAFAGQVRALRAMYEIAHVAGHPGAKIPPSQVFASFK